MKTPSQDKKPPKVTRPHPKDTEPGEDASYWDRTLDLIAQGETLASICAPQSWPSTSAVLNWAKSCPIRSAAYAAAREAAADVFADQLHEIADSLGRTSTREEIDAARLQIDVRKWTAAKLRPASYGDRVAVDARVAVATMPVEALVQEVQTIAARSGLSLAALLGLAAVSGSGDNPMSGTSAAAPAAPGNANPPRAITAQPETIAPEDRE